MSGSRKPGPVQSGPIDVGTTSRQRMPDPRPVGHSQQHPKRAVFVDQNRREVLVFELKEFVKFIAVTLGQAFPPIKDVATDVRRLLNEVGFGGKLRIATYNGEQYVILGGNPALRKFLTGTRYKANNPKVVEMLLTDAGRARAAAKGTAVSIVLVVATDIISFFLSDDQTWEDLGLTISVDAVKTIGASVAGFVAAALVAGAGVAVLPVVSGIFVAVAVGILLDKAFPTDRLVKAIEAKFAEIEGEIDSSLEQFERGLMSWTMQNSFLGY